MNLAALTRTPTPSTVVVTGRVLTAAGTAADSRRTPHPASPGYTGGIGTTMSLFPKCRHRPAPANAPVAFGFRGMQTSNPRTQHMGIRLNGRWYSAGGRGNRKVVTGDSRWDHVVIPPGL